MAANAGYKFFSIRNFGMCFGVGYGKKSFDDFNLKVSEYCVAPNFDVCEDSHEHCVGVNSGEFIYETKVKPASKGTEFIRYCKFFCNFAIYLLKQVKDMPCISVVYFDL